MFHQKTSCKWCQTSCTRSDVVRSRYRCSLTVLQPECVHRRPCSTDCGKTWVVQQVSLSLSLSIQNWNWLFQHTYCVMSRRIYDGTLVSTTTLMCCFKIFVPSKYDWTLHSIRPVMAQKLGVVRNFGYDGTTRCSIKKETLIFDHNSRISWSINIILAPVETGMNTPQYRVIYLLNCLFMS